VGGGSSHGATSSSSGVMYGTGSQGGSLVDAGGAYATPYGMGSGQYQSGHGMTVQQQGGGGGQGYYHMTGSSTSSSNSNHTGGGGDGDAYSSYVDRHGGSRGRAGGASTDSYGRSSDGQPWGNDGSGGGSGGYGGGQALPDYPQPVRPLPHASLSLPD